MNATEGVSPRPEAALHAAFASIDALDAKRAEQARLVVALRISLFRKLIWTLCPEPDRVADRVAVGRPLLRYLGHDRDLLRSVSRARTPYALLDWLAREGQRPEPTTDGAS